MGVLERAVVFLLEGVDDLHNTVYSFVDCEMSLFAAHVGLNPLFLLDAG